MEPADGISARTVSCRKGTDRALYGAKTGNKGCCLWLGEEQPLRLQVEVKEQENLKTAGKMAREVHNEEV